MMKQKRKFVKQLRKDEEEKYEEYYWWSQREIAFKLPKKRKQTIHENLDDEAKKKLCKSDQERKQTIRENLDDEAKEILHESDW